MLHIHTPCDIAIFVVRDVLLWNINPDELNSVVFSSIYVALIILLSTDWNDYIFLK